MIEAALSPCPNDTYLFHAWVEGRVGEAIPVDPTFADIQQLNEWALLKKFPLIKLSFSCFAKVLDHYELLPIGAALGHNCGPLVIAHSPTSLNQLSTCRVAIPGKETTAHLLYNHFCPDPIEKVFCTYDEVYQLLHQKKVDAGVIIHESRFTFEQEGFYKVADLGELWEIKYHLPIPLGGLAISRELDESQKQRIFDSLTDSLKWAHHHPQDSEAFILSHSQEKNLDIVTQHIHTYVNAETHHLSALGIKAIEHLLRLPHPKWLWRPQ